MSTLLPGFLTELYDLREVKLVVHDVRSRDLRNCAKTLSFISQWVRDSGDAEMLSELRSFTARILFAFRNAPIPYNVLNDSKLSLRKYEVFSRASQTAEAGGEALRHAVEELRVGLEQLSKLPNPMIDRYCRITQGTGFDRCFVPRKHFLWGMNPEEVGKLVKIPLKTFEHEACVGAKACFFGQLRAYQFLMKDSFLLSPRFHEIHLIGESTCGEVNHYLSKASLAFSTGGQRWLSAIRIQPAELRPTDVQADDDDSDSPQGGIPPEMIDRLLERLDVTDVLDETSGAGRKVTSMAFLVADARMLLLRESAQPRLLVLERPIRTSTKPVSELEAGDVVLLRNESVDVRAEFQDALHDEWKAQLSMRIELGLMEEVIDFLKQAGHPHTAVAIRNWCEASHGPEKRETFVALMEYLALDRVEERWATINAFREIGHEAGLAATEALRTKFKQLDDEEIAQLKSGGLVEKRIQSGVANQASMVAVTVEAVLARSVQVKQHLLGKVIPIPDELLWLS